eukprot:TRINITY_DN33911_c0_g1_i3.p1 TRINITY_DN33911_c0_g1~~TRINITY_DN33911_c0_g1_i3.p1  ORF type:complete len:144 (+),score=8.12 TRINITY_DN33911_c0_g1_i3:85-516(+)
MFRVAFSGDALVGVAFRRFLANTAKNAKNKNQQAAGTRGNVCDCEAWISTSSSCSKRGPSIHSSRHCASQAVLRVLRQLRKGLAPSYEGPSSVAKGVNAKTGVCQSSKFAWCVPVRRLRGAASCGFIDLSICRTFIFHVNAFT